MTTAFDITLRVAELCKHVRRGTATGGSTTTLIDSNHPTRPDDYYNGQPQGTIWFITGDNAGKTAVITDWVNSSHTFTFATQAAALAAGVEYAALPGTFSREALLAALNAAMLDAGPGEFSLDITAETDGYRYALTIPPDQIVKVEVLASGASTPKEYFWWSAHTGYLYMSANLPAAGDTIRVFYTDAPARVTADSATLPYNIDAARLAWLTLWHACLPKMQQAENTDPMVKELFEQADKMRNEFMVRRPTNRRAPAPHFANW